MTAMDSFLTHLGLCFRAGKLAVGEEPVCLALADGKARVVFIAADASERTRRKLEPKLGSVPLETLPATKAATGSALGRESCAICAVTDKGFAQSLTKRLDQTPNAHPDGGVTI